MYELGTSSEGHMKGLRTLGFAALIVVFWVFLIFYSYNEEDIMVFPEEEHKKLKLGY